MNILTLTAKDINWSGLRTLFPMVESYNTDFLSYYDVRDREFYNTNCYERDYMITFNDLTQQAQKRIMDYFLHMIFSEKRNIMNLSLGYIRTKAACQSCGNPSDYQVCSFCLHQSNV